MTIFEIFILIVLAGCFGLATFLVSFELLKETYIAELFRRTLEYRQQKKWLRLIERESVRYNKYKTMSSHSGYIAKALLNRYNELYGEVKDE